MIGARPLCIKLDKTDGFIRLCDGTRYLVLFGDVKYDSIYNRIRCFIRVKSSITYVFSHNFERIKVDFYNSNSLPLERILALQNGIIFIKLVLTKDPNHYYYNIYLEKCSYQLAKK